MTANTGVAYDAAYPNVDAIVAAHPLYVDVYTDGPHAWAAGDVAKVRAAGFGVKFNHERAIDQMSSTLGGQQAATAAVAAVLGYGCPANAGVAIYYSVDLSVPTSQFANYSAGFRAANEVHAGRFLVGVYGEGALIDYLTSLGLVQVKGWLSASSSFPGYNPSSPNVGEYQLVGTDVPSTDKDIITDATHMGVWWTAGHAPAVPATTPKENEMVIIATTNPARSAVFADHGVYVPDSATLSAFISAGKLPVVNVSPAFYDEATTSPTANTEALLKQLVTNTTPPVQIVQI